jgi:hypothetical protein
MKRAMWKKLKAGTLVAIPASSDQFLIGQVLIPGITFHMQVHSMWIQNPSDCHKALESPILLFGETTDGELGREKWLICGHAPCPTSFFRPYHVVNSPDGLVLCDFDKRVIRQANGDDFKKYGYQTSSSSPVFSRAVSDCFHSKSEANFEHLDARIVAKRCEL